MGRSEVCAGTLWICFGMGKSQLLRSCSPLSMVSFFGRKKYNRLLDPVVLETHKNRRCRPVGESQDTGRNRRQAQVSQAVNDDSSEILRRVQDKLGQFSYPLKNFKGFSLVKVLWEFQIRM